MPDSNIQPESEPQSLEETVVPPVLMRYRKVLIVLAHMAAFALSLMLSFLIANNMQFKREWLVEQYSVLLAFFIVIKLVVFGLFKQYRGWWRYVSISDLISITSASVMSTLIVVVLWFAVVLNVDPIRRALQSIVDISQSIFMLDMAGTVLLLAGMRMVIRLYYEEFRTVEGGRLKRFLIVGAGNAGEALLREIHRMPVAEYQVIGFIDDDPLKQNISIHGIPVLGNVEQLSELCQERNIEEIAIAMPSASHRQLRRVIEVCEGSKVGFRTVPSITDDGDPFRFKDRQRGFELWGALDGSGVMNPLALRIRQIVDSDGTPSSSRNQNAMVAGPASNPASTSSLRMPRSGPQRRSGSCWPPHGAPSTAARAPPPPQPRTVSAAPRRTRC